MTAVREWRDRAVRPRRERRADAEAGCRARRRGQRDRRQPRRPQRVHRHARAELRHHPRPCRGGRADGAGGVPGCVSETGSAGGCQDGYGLYGASGSPSAPTAATSTSRRDTATESSCSTALPRRLWRCRRPTGGPLACRASRVARNGRVRFQLSEAGDAVRIVVQRTRRGRSVRVRTVSLSGHAERTRHACASAHAAATAPRSRRPTGPATAPRRGAPASGSCGLRAAARGDFLPLGVRDEG